MKIPFAHTLTALRKAANLTDEALAQLADVPRSLITGLQNGARIIGEQQARKIAAALKLEGNALRDFVFDAMNTCTMRVLAENQNYPAEVVNFAANHLQDKGIDPEYIAACEWLEKYGDQAQALILKLEDGSKAEFKADLRKLLE
jgi:transcriptional regulator with XRE-family HTH domain